MADDLLFTEEEMAIDEGLGYPKAFAKLCRDRSVSPYNHAPPLTFTPYALQQNEVLRAGDLDEMFPIIDPKAKPSAKPKIFISLLWKQLNHLGNAGFDPAIFRVDPYGNVLYYHADSASPLAWDIDHWFPCSRGGLTVPSNLRLLQWQVCKKKHNKLEFLVPWWDLQVGISINQFLSVFASSNSDFRHRAFSLLFAEGECEELNDSHTVESHAFPQHFIESKEKLGLAPAAIVLCRRESHDASSSALKSLDINRRPRSNSPIVAARKLRSSMTKENVHPDMVTNPYQAIVMARDSLRHREETAKMQAEIQKLDDEVDELKQKTDEEKVAIQELELVLIKRRRRAEKCRRLAEAQSSYRAMLEKMIRDAMHQSVIYKEQLRLNQAAANALMARLEAQKAMCDSSERELHRKFKQRDELETQIRPQGEYARKRSRVDDLAFEEKDDRTGLYLPSSKLRTNLQKEIAEAKAVLYLPGIESAGRLHKELRVLLAEEQKTSEAGLYLNEERKQEELEEEGIGRLKDFSIKSPKESNEEVGAAEDGNWTENKHKLQPLKIGEQRETCNIKFPIPRDPEDEEEDEESRRLRGKRNIDKWLQILEDTQEGSSETNLQNGYLDENSKTDEIIRKLNLKYPQPEIKDSQERERNHGGEGEKERVQIGYRRSPPYKLLKEKAAKANEVETAGKGVESSRSSFANEMDTAGKRGVECSRSSFEGGEARKERQERRGKEKGIAKTIRRIPSSPSLILGMKKGADCIRKKPSVTCEDDGDENRATGNFFQAIMKAVKM